MYITGEKQFMLGEEPTELDCAIFGQLSQVKWHVPEQCKARKYLEGIAKVQTFLIPTF